MQLPGPGVWGPPRDHDRAIRVLQRAVELGVNLIDTADSYGPYVVEELICEALYPYPEDLVIATKAGLTRFGPVTRSGPTQEDNMWGASIELTADEFAQLAAAAQSSTRSS